MGDGDGRTEEERRLAQAARRERDWKRWGPYLSERQWGTVREDYSADGDGWGYFPHDHARSRAYRWGEDGLLGICRPPVPAVLRARALERQGPDPQGAPVRPDRTRGQPRRGRQGAATTTSTPRRPHSYTEGALQVPAGASSPTRELVEENRRRGRDEPRVRARRHRRLRRGPLLRRRRRVRQGGRPNDILHPHHGRPTAARSRDAHVLPTLWFRNTWSWGRDGEGYWPRSRASRADGRPLRRRRARDARRAPPARRRADGATAPRAALHRERDEHRSGSSARRTPRLRQGRLPRVRHRRARRTR